ncbi:MAG: 1-acyl-sn-glycerol-3-phosphate acyltransferase [Ahrensia sp.]|nr:1-acyl-sn-glycerol-3-phosphate acyltransferase [Ahrensia sp.]
MRLSCAAMLFKSIAIISERVLAEKITKTSEKMIADCGMRMTDQRLEASVVQLKKTPRFGQRSLIGNLRMVLLISAMAIVTAAFVPFHAYFRWTKHPLRKTIATKWHRLICRLFGFKIEVRGRLADGDDHGVLIVANHVSWTDIMILSSLMPISFVAKDEVKNWPLFGTFARWQESIFVDRNARANTKQQALAISGRLMSGDNIVLFPEGTTSDGNFIYPFKSSLFGALGIGDEILSSPIQPVSIAYVSQHGLPMGRFERPLAAWPGDIQLMPHLTRLLREGHLGVIVSFGDPICIKPSMNRKDISKEAQHSVAQMTSDALRGLLPLPTDAKTH